jgi:hypothetical protein
MEAWNGDDSYTFDRVLRGRTHIEHACLSALGAATPSSISQYIQGVEESGAAGDGLIQRFGLMVWPDISAEWEDVDIEPDWEAYEMARSVFERFDELNPMEIGAALEPWEDMPFLRFTPEASQAFVQWRGILERSVRTGRSGPMLDAHFSKYRKLVPTLALLHHLATPNSGGPIPEPAIQSAIRFSIYLSQHAERIYASAAADSLGTSMRAILRKIQSEELMDGFKLRDIQRKGWTKLGKEDPVQAALDRLTALYWIYPQIIREATKGEEYMGGRPSKIYRINPKAYGRPVK